MKKFLISLVILFAEFMSMEAQNYEPLPMQNCYWMIYPSNGTYNINTMSTCIYNDVYKIVPQGDTLINAKHYVKFYSYYISGNGINVSPPCNPYTAPTNTVTYYFAVRQDTAARKLYLIYPNSNTEKLMFDFTQSVGDTVKAVSGAFGSTPPGGTTPYRVIDSVYYRSYSDGLCRKVYKLKPFINSVGLTANTEIVEGIGNETGLEIKVKSATNSGSSQAYGNSKLVINSSTLIASDNNTCLGVGLQEHDVDAVSLYPNPVSSVIHITNQKTETIRVYLYSAEGREVRRVVLNGNSNISLDLSGLAEGCYYLRSISYGLSSFKKIIKAQP